jgi:hypothetical protein
MFIWQWSKTSILLLRHWTWNHFSLFYHENGFLQINFNSINIYYRCSININTCLHLFLNNLSWNQCSKIVNTYLHLLSHGPYLHISLIHNTMDIVHITPFLWIYIYKKTQTPHFWLSHQQTISIRIANKTNKSRISKGTSVTLDTTYMEKKTLCCHCLISSNDK